MRAQLLLGTVGVVATVPGCIVIIMRLGSLNSLSHNIFRLNRLIKSIVLFLRNLVLILNCWKPKHFKHFVPRKSFRFLDFKHSFQESHRKI